MARIETYPLDGNITVNDYVIGTDGDSLNATKNYKVLTFLDYLGTMYNLNSTDLLFNYNDVAAGSVANGQVSTNNFADGTILMSGVTNIYVSKVSAFGQIVDDIINTTGTEGLSIMFTDMGNRNNLGIFTVNFTADVDANTIAMSVTSTTAVGNIDAGKVMGIRIGVGGGGATGNFVTVDTIQTVTGAKTFTGITNLSGFNTTVSGNLFVQSDSFFQKPIISRTTSGVDDFEDINAEAAIGYVGNSKWALRVDAITDNYITFNLSSIGGVRDYRLPPKSGTIALLDDIPDSSDSDWITSSTLENSMTGSIQYRKIGNSVMLNLEFNPSTRPVSLTDRTIFTLPSGFRPSDYVVYAIAAPMGGATGSTTDADRAMVWIQPNGEINIINIDTIPKSYVFSSSFFAD